MPLARAQQMPGREQEAQPANTIAQDVLVIIQQEKVRFTAQKAGAEMQLQIFDQAGKLVYDSGAVTEPELTWALRQADGETVKSGLYAYTLSVKDAGAETGKVRRGHFIVDRARERDGQTDRLWITTQNEGGVGTELTVARNEGVTIAGASATSEHKGARAADGNAHNNEGTARSVESESRKENNRGMSALVSGTTGQIAKFTSATDLGNSEMTELNGKIGIGTTNPTSKLEIAAQDGLAITGYQPFLTLRDTNTGGKRSIMAGGYGDFGFYPDSFIGQYPPVVIKNHSGNVGIGIHDPGFHTRLNVVANSNLTAVSGTTVNGYGVIGTTTDGIGVVGVSGPYGYAGSFYGNVRVTGSVTPTERGAFNLGEEGLHWRFLHVIHVYQASDARLKKSVANLRYGLRELMQLRPVSYEWKDQSNKQLQLGLIAQETQQIIPEAVARPEDPAKPLSLNYTALIPVVIKAIQQQQSDLTTLKSDNEALQLRNAALQQQNSDLEARLTALEQMVQQLSGATAGPVRQAEASVQKQQR